MFIKDTIKTQFKKGKDKPSIVAIYIFEKGLLTKINEVSLQGSKKKKRSNKKGEGVRPKGESQTKGCRPSFAVGEMRIKDTMSYCYIPISLKH